MPYHAIPLLLLLAPFNSGASLSDGLHVEGTRFIVVKNGVGLGSEALTGAEIDLAGGVTLRIDAVRQDPSEPSILLHAMSVRDSTGEWQTLCAPDRDGKSEGFPLRGRWNADGNFLQDSRHFAMACTSSARGKCVRFGYKPWESTEDGRSLRPLYEACVRLVRADYCGNGTASTVEGTEIDIYDDHGVMDPTSDPAFVFEAGWTAGGAVCVDHTRIPENLSLEMLGEKCPRLANATGQVCTEDFAREHGAVIFNRSRIAP